MKKNFELYYTLEDIMGIYCIECILSGKKYIGSSIFITNRLGRHLSQLKHHKHCNDYLMKSFKCYGIENFQVYILEKVEDINILIDKEQYWIDFYKTYDRNFGFNFGISAKNPFLGRKHTEESKRLVSIANTGRKRSKESCLMQSKKMIGRKFSEERKRKMSECARLCHDDEKVVIKLVSPEGKLIIRKGLRSFCLEFKLTRSHFCKLKRGAIPHYKGWRIYDGHNLVPMILEKKDAYDIEAKKEKIRKARLGKPSSKKWEYLYLINNNIIYKSNRLSKFCKEFQIPTNLFSQMVNGHRNEYKGWSIYLHDPINPPQNIIEKIY